MAELSRGGVRFYEAARVSVRFSEAARVGVGSGDMGGADRHHRRPRAPPQGLKSLYFGTIIIITTHHHVYYTSS